MANIEIYNLSSFNAPCYILKYRGVTFMIDCALDNLPLLSFMPFSNIQEKEDQKLNSSIAFNDGFKIYLKSIQHQNFIDSTPLFGVPCNHISFSEIDIILISNYQNILALPYITEYSDFNGLIYATDPTYQFGRLYMKEAVSYLERFSKPSLSFKQIRQLSSKSYQNRLPQNIKSVFKNFYLHSSFNNKDIEACLNKIKTVSFQESIDIFGLLTCLPTSAGYCIGSCNWVIQSEYEKVVYISKSSTLTAHPKPLDLVNIREPDVVILTELTRTPEKKPDAMITEFSKAVLSTLHSGGNVLIPCPLSGVTFDLLECLHLSLGFTGQSIRDPMIYFISPEAKSSLAYANIFSEWLCSTKQVKVYLPEEPFVHAEMIAQGSLAHYEDVGSSDFNRDFRTPCIIFAGHVGLRYGPALNFLRLWKSDPSNALVLIDPNLYDASAGIDGGGGVLNETLAPFQPIHAKVFECPIDTGLSSSHVRKLLKDMKPKRAVVCPAMYEGLVRDAMANTEHDYELIPIGSGPTPGSPDGSDPSAPLPSPSYRVSIPLGTPSSSGNGDESDRRTYQKVRLAEGSTTDYLTAAGAAARVVETGLETFLGPAFEGYVAALNNNYTLDLDVTHATLPPLKKVKNEGDNSLVKESDTRTDLSAPFANIVPWGDLNASRLIKRITKAGLSVRKLAQAEAEKVLQNFPTTSPHSSTKSKQRPSTDLSKKPEEIVLKIENDDSEVCHIRSLKFNHHVENVDSNSTTSPHLFQSTQIICGTGGDHTHLSLNSLRAKLTNILMEEINKI